MLRLIALGGALAAIMIAAAPAAAGPPSGGNGNQSVIPIVESYQLACGSESLTVDVNGWVKVRLFNGSGNKNLELDVYHVAVTYTNAAGKRWVYHDVGPDHLYLDSDGNLILTVTGRPGDPTGEGFSLSGHAVINLTTGEVIAVHGNQGESPDVAACNRLG
jgi:hypothetical protein